MPRILTNKYGLPNTLYDAIKYDTHKLAGDISVTTLIDAPQVRLLKKKHTYEEDVVDGLYALMGTALQDQKIILIPRYIRPGLLSCYV